MAELTYFSVISRVDGSSGKRRITIHPKIEGGRRSTDVHQVNEGGPPDTGDGANLFSSRGRACDAPYGSFPPCGPPLARVNL